MDTVTVKVCGESFELDPFDCGEVPPVCRECVGEGHMVEPDGVCPHGKPSVLLRMGLV